MIFTKRELIDALKGHTDDDIIMITILVDEELFIIKELRTLPLNIDKGSLIGEKGAVTDGAEWTLAICADLKNKQQLQTGENEGD
jgi:hypothetical protein